MILQAKLGRTTVLMLIVTTLLWMGAFTGAADAQSGPKKLTKVVWGVDSFLTTLPQRIAKELGYFQEEGVDIEFQVSALGIASMDSIIAGAADLGNGAHWALAIRMTKPNLSLGGFILAWRTPVHLMAAPTVKSLSDLKGRRIATITGSLWDWYTQKALEAGGVNRKEATLQNFGAPIDYLAAAVRGDIDAAWFWEVNLLKAREALEPKGWRSLATRGDVAPQAAIDGHGPLPISMKAAAEKPEALAGALRAYKRAGDWCTANRDECAKLANKLMAVPVEDAKKMLPDMGYYVGFPKKYVELMKEMKVFALAQGYIRPTDDYDFDKKIVTGPIKLAFPGAVDF